MNDYGTVFRRTIGIDNKGFLIRQFPVVSYRQQRQPFEYLRRGTICVLPIDAINPRDMLINIYKFNEVLADKIVSTMRSIKMDDILQGTDEEYLQYNYFERAAIVRAATMGSPIVYLNDSANIVPTENGLIVPLLYSRAKRKRTKNFNYGEDEFDGYDGHPRTKLSDSGLKGLREAYEAGTEHYQRYRTDFTVGKDYTVVSASGHEAISDSLRTPGERWAAPVWAAELVPTMDSLAHDLATRWEWNQHMHNKVSEVVNAERTHTSYDSTFTLYF